jgi:predicted nucleic acid-binding protein
MKYLLHTDTLIDCILGINETRQRVYALIEQGDEVALCPITVAELYSGMTEKRRTNWESWLKALSYWHISIMAAMRAGGYRKAASKSGRTIPVTDALLAAIAHENDATLLTSNIKDYPMKDIRVLSLREEAA